MQKLLAENSFLKGGFKLLVMTLYIEEVGRAARGAVFVGNIIFCCIYSVCIYNNEL